MRLRSGLRKRRKVNGFHRRDRRGRRERSKGLTTEYTEGHREKREFARSLDCRFSALSATSAVNFGFLGTFYQRGFAVGDLEAEALSVAHGSCASLRHDDGVLTAGFAGDFHTRS